MKLKFAFTGASSIVFATSGFAVAFPDNSHISAVTVYPDRAMIMRVATIDVAEAGPVEVTFEKLPAALIDQSLQVTGRGIAQTTLLDVTPHSTFVSFTPNERVKSLEDELRGLTRQDRTLADRSKLLGQQREYVLKIQNATTAPPKEGSGPPPPVDTWTNLLTFSADQLNKISTELESIDAQREDLQAKRTALEQQLNELRGEGGRSYKTIVVRLSASTGGKLDLTLRYATPNASWTPSYDARVSSGEHAVQLGYFGLVRQNTGEDWHDVDLTLSTARPSLGGSPPELSPWIVQQQQIVPLRPFETSSVRNEAFKTASSLAGSRVPAVEIRDMATAVTSVETQATSATFHSPTKADIPADNAPHKVGVAVVALKTELNYQATPKLLPSAFLSARVTNTSDFPLLAGAMNVFLDDTFVASSTLHSVMPGEKFDLALGADEAIAVKRKLNNRFTEDTGLVTKGKRITYDVTLTVQNNKKTAEQIVLQDQVPVSRHEKIVVKILAPDESEAKPDADGIIKWNLSLKPGEKREVPLKFSIEYPNDLPVTGLE